MGYWLNVQLKYSDRVPTNTFFAVEFVCKHKKCKVLQQLKKKKAEEPREKREKLSQAYVITSAVQLQTWSEEGVNVRRSVLERIDQTSGHPSGRASAWLLNAKNRRDLDGTKVKTSPLTSELGTEDLILPVCIRFVIYCPLVPAAGCCLWTIAYTNRCYSSFPKAIRGVAEAGKQWWCWFIVSVQELQ